MRIVALVLIVFVLFSCSSKVPKEVIAPEKMEEIVSDLSLVDEYINLVLVRDSTLDLKKKRSVMYEQVFTLHKTSRKEFYSSFKYYQQHPDLQKELFENVQKNMERKSKSESKTVPVKTNPA